MGTQKASPIASAVGLLVFIGMMFYLFGGECEKQTASNVETIYQQVALDAMEQYKIVKRNGSAVDACAQAGVVSAALLQAKMEAEYRDWQPMKKADCRRAGLPEWVY